MTGPDFAPLTDDERADAASAGDAGGKPARWTSSLPGGSSARYDYRDAGGEIAFAVLRRDGPPRKRFAPYTPEKRGDRDGWRTGYPPGLRPLYRLPELLAADPADQVLVVEGEKCADAVAAVRIGGGVTTWAGGSAAWRQTDWKPLAGRRVLLVADADKPGRKAMRDLAAHLAPSAAEVRIALPEGDDGRDVADEIEAGGARGAAAWLKALARPFEATPAAADGDADGDWREALVEAAEADPGAPFGSDALGRIVALRRDDRAAWETLRAKLKDETKVRVGELDKALDRADRDADQAGAQGRPVEYDDPDPWPDPVDGAEVLNAYETLFDEYAVTPEGGAAAASVWALFAWVFRAFGVCPNLMISAPERGSGKTTLTGLLSWMVPRANPVSDASAAAIYRGIARDRPTLLFDEAQHFLKRRPEDPVRGILLASFTRRFAFVDRCEGEANEVRRFDVYAPKAMNGRNLVGIDDMLTSRSVVIPMTRSPRRLPELREDRDPVGAELRRKAARWRDDNMDRLQAADPDMGDLIHRGAQVWRPLFAVADAAGGDWPAKIRAAARALTEAAERIVPGDTLGVELLRDCRQAFEDAGDPDRMQAKALDAALHGMDERPWGTLTHGKDPMTPQWRGRKLSGFGVKVTKKREGGKTPGFYYRADFREAWDAYLPETGDSKPEHRNNGGNTGFSDDSKPEHPDPVFRFENTPEPAESLDCSGVPVSRPGGSEQAPLDGAPDDPDDDPDPEREAIMREHEFAAPDPDGGPDR